MDEALARIEASLIRLGRPVVQMLKSGIDGEIIRSSLGSRGLEAGPELIRFYGWRNGTQVPIDATLDDLHLIPGFYFLSIEDATLNYDAFVKSSRWDRAWVPLLANGGGDFFAVDCSSGDAQGNVHHFRIEESEHPAEYRSVGDMLETFAAAFESGAFYVDDDGFLEMDDTAYEMLAAALNPSVPWWTD